MQKLSPLEMATFDINALSQEERTAFYREAIRRAHAARAEAVNALFRALAKRFRRQPLLARALVDSAAILAMVIALGATVSAPVSARMAGVSVPPIHVNTIRMQERPYPSPSRELKRPSDCGVTDATAYLQKGCAPLAL